MDRKKQELFLKIVLGFLLLQPVFDILSYLAIRDIIVNISTYVKPLFVFGFGGYLLLFYNKDKTKWFSYIAIFLLFLIGHFYILYKLLIPLNTMLHEFRFIINIAYMIGLFIIFKTIYSYYEDKKRFMKVTKYAVLGTFLLYFSLYLIAIASGTSSLTYEYADALKKGFKGWFDSSQILGHAFSIMFPILLYIIMRPKQKWYKRVIILSIFILSVSLIGTKVPYYITIIVLILYVIISLGGKIFNKQFNKNYFNIFLAFSSVIIMFLTYQYTPVAYNTKLNNANAQVDVGEYDMNDINGSSNIDSIDGIIKENEGKDVSRLIEYNKWNKEASEYLEKLFKEKKVHPSNMRLKQFYYSNKKFMLSSVEYKLFGIGYLNQESNLSIESDFLMSFYCFGIVGFLLFLLIPIYEFIKSTIFILKNLKIVDLETYLLYMGLGIFFCISLYDGYTYIYTNFSIFLVILLVLLNLKLDLIKEYKFNGSFETDDKKISFLMLHLGYGGIESATINTANALCSKYKVEIISFYKLANNQKSKLNKKVNVKYLYNGGPNKEEFLNSLHNKKIFKMLKEGLISINILIKKKLFIIDSIKYSNSKYIVSTRVEFSELLSKYGKNDVIKIAQEHHHHNNNKKYINRLQHNYKNIDYLCALTTSLKKDYEMFLSKNKHTKIITLPNMLDNIPREKSNLKNKNLITISRLDPGKRNNEIIDIVKNLNDKEVKLTIIGDGQEFKNLQEQICNLNLEEQVTLTGYLSKEEIKNYFLDSSIFLMASISEGLPMVLLEAMSYGLPCIAYETESGVNDIIDNNINGFVIKDRNKKEYINKLKELLSDTTKRIKFGDAAKNKSLKFSNKEILKIWTEILK